MPGARVDKRKIFSELFNIGKLSMEKITLLQMNVGFSFSRKLPSGNREVAAMVSGLLLRLVSVRLPHW